MALTDKACKNAKPGERELRLSDGGNLYLHVLSGGTKSWRFRYRFAGKQKQFVLGSLVDARNARNEALSLVERDLDPLVDRHQKKVALRQEELDSFERVAREWHGEATSNRAPRYARQILERMERHVFKEFGSILIKKVTAPEGALPNTDERRSARGDGDIRPASARYARARRCGRPTLHHMTSALG